MYKRQKLRGGDMRIALINENSQGAKNGMIYNSLKKVADQYGFEVDNYGTVSYTHLLEVFDFDMDKAALIGPAPYAARFAADMRTTNNNFGLLVDLSHFPTTYETSRFVIHLRLLRLLRAVGHCISGDGLRHLHGLRHLRGHPVLQERQSQNHRYRPGLHPSEPDSLLCHLFRQHPASLLHLSE